jgi:hypothetical protein
MACLAWGRRRHGPAAGRAVKVNGSLGVVANFHANGLGHERGAPEAEPGAKIITEASSSDSCRPAVNASA